jgi:hypothetical protein
MRMLILVAALLSAAPAFAQPPETYDVWEVTRDADGRVTEVAQVGVFTAKPAPEPTLGGHLLALDNENGRQHVAVQHGKPAPVLVDPPEPQP